MKALSLNVSHFKFCAMLVKKVQCEFAFSVFFSLSMLVVTEIHTDSFEGNISDAVAKLSRFIFVFK